ncbi:MAG: hypothetical protein ACJA1C_001022 [Crocinitomicaceae bacterium]|jgi:hypothetical protein
MKTSLIACLLFICFNSFGFELDKSYNWNRTFDGSNYETQINHDEEATIVFDKSLYYYYSDNGTLKLKCFKHRLIWIEDESAIEKLNEVYLPGSASMFKARIINSDGKVLSFDENRIEEISTNEGTSSYQKLALPGIEPKSWVEVYYVLTDLNRSERVTLNDDFTTALGQVVIREPVNWRGKFDLKIEMYNGYEKNELNDDQFSHVYEVKNIPSVGSENYAHQYMDSPRCDFTIVKTSWSEWSRLVLKSVNRYDFSTFIGAVRKTLKEIDALEGTDVEKIKKIELFVKQNITETEQDDAKYTEHIGKILKFKIANETGILATYMHLFSYAGIKFDLYLAGDKDYIDLDENMPSSRGFDEYIFHFKSLDLYLLPNSDYYYLGRIPSHIGGMNALRIVGTPGSKYFTRLPQGLREYNTEITKSTIELNVEEEVCSIHLKKSYNGDRAIRARGYLNFSDEEEKKDYIDGALLSGMETTELKSFKVINDDIILNQMSEDSIHFIGDLISDEMVSTIPNGFILNVSRAMGGQSSFYEEGERQRRIYVSNSRIYEHNIRFVIPDGYELQNIENYRFDRNYTPAGADAPVAAFESKAQIRDGVLELYVYEFYQEGMYPKEDLEAYKLVINAAYEFYIAKVMLIKE